MLHLPGYLPESGNMGNIGNTAIPTRLDFAGLFPLLPLLPEMGTYPVFCEFVSFLNSSLKILRFRVSVVTALAEIKSYVWGGASDD